MKDILLSRRELIGNGLKSAAGLGLASMLGNFSADPVLGQTRGVEEIMNYEAAEVCQLTCLQTLGPCYSANPPVRVDITSGKQGMPMRLGFRVVDSECLPISNATVDIWHTDVNGVYSALAGFCANGDPNAPSQNFLRGVQPTDSDGWAYFDTVFPGWYPSRTTHIHATIRIGTTAMVTTQFYFLDRINKHVYKNHPLYIHRPNPSTTNTTDNILGGSMARMMPYIFSTKFAGTKPLRAWKTIVLSAAPTTCNA